VTEFGASVNFGLRAVSKVYELYRLVHHWGIAMFTECEAFNMADSGLEFAFDCFSERYGVDLSDFEKEEMVKNISGYFAALNDADLANQAKGKEL
jgi:hypothetical protein